MAAPDLARAWPEAQLTRVGVAGGREALVWRCAADGEVRGHIAFSHGSHSAPWKYARLIRGWQEAGYDVWAPLHVDSTDHPAPIDPAAGDTWQPRLADMRAAARLIGRPYIAAGHSYGALTALVLGGVEAQVPQGWQGPLRDPLVRCVVALSPPPPFPGLIDLRGYAALAVPALIQTGDRDLIPGWPDTGLGWRMHLPAYDQAVAGGNRYLLVLDGVDHFFGGAIGELGQGGKPQLAELGRAAEIINDFLQAYREGASPEAGKALQARLSSTSPARLQTR
jgi:hypothetical protein